MVQTFGKDTSLDTSLREVWHVKLEGDPEEDAGHTGKAMYVGWPGNAFSPPINATRGAWG